MSFYNKKYIMQYISKYGVFSCMSLWDIKSPYNSTEEVYKACIEKGVTWQTLLGFKGYKNGVLL